MVMLGLKNPLCYSETRFCYQFATGTMCTSGATLYS
jgi:hypothetical protein